MAFVTELAPPSQFTGTRPPRDKADQRRRNQLLFRRYQRDGDMAARRELIESFLPLARMLARRYEGRGESLEDLLQVASLGLVKAIDRYEAHRGLEFSSALDAGAQDITRDGDNFEVTCDPSNFTAVQEALTGAKIPVVSAEITQVAKAPLDADKETAKAVEEVLEAIEANAAYGTASLDAPLRSVDHEHNTIAEAFGEVDGRFDLIECRASIGPALKALPSRERTILYLRFVEDRTQSEIAQRIGISQMHVSRLIRSALDRIRVVTGDA